MESTGNVPPSLHTRTAAAAAGCVIILGTLRTWGSQYYVDYEVSLLPWLVSKGWVLYRDIADQHTPLLAALLMPFGGAGDPGVPLQMVVVGLRLVTLFLTYLGAARMAGAVAGLGAVILAELWAVVMEGTHLWYDGMLGVVYLLVLLLIVRGRQSREGASPLLPLLAGLLLGAGVMIKQHAVVAAPFIALFWWAGGSAGWRGRLALFVAGFSAPILATTAVYAAHGALGDAWYWTVLYNLTGDYPRLAGMLPGASEWPVLAALFGPVLLFALACGMRHDPDKDRWLVVGILGLLLAAALPMVPRYGRFHLQGLVPLAAVLGAVSASYFYSRTRSSRRGAVAISRLALGLLGVCALVGLAQWVQGLGLNFRPGAVAAPYAGTVEPLREWVDTYAPPGSPTFIYGVDPLLYRLLEREPTRPWSSQLPWVLGAAGTEARWWGGFIEAKPPVVLVAARGWDANGEGSQEAQLRENYREDRRFVIRNYRGAEPLEVVGLLRIDGPTR